MFHPQTSETPRNVPKRRSIMIDHDRSISTIQHKPCRELGVGFHMFQVSIKTRAFSGSKSSESSKNHPKNIQKIKQNIQALISLRLLRYIPSHPTCGFHLFRPPPASCVENAVAPEEPGNLGLAMEVYPLGWQFE